MATVAFKSLSAAYTRLLRIVVYLLLAVAGLSVLAMMARSPAR